VTRCLSGAGATVHGLQNDLEAIDAAYKTASAFLTDQVDPPGIPASGAGIY